jgi:hypothetical protein
VSEQVEFVREEQGGATMVIFRKAEDAAPYLSEEAPTVARVKDTDLAAQKPTDDELREMALGHLNKGASRGGGRGRRGRGFRGRGGGRGRGGFRGKRQRGGGRW